VAVLHIEAREDRLAEALLLAGRLSEAEALRRSLVERELGRLLDDWARRWLEK
jgi:hypothetical protein